MSYKIAVATSDYINVDETFGQAKRFIIYEADGKNFKKLEERDVEDDFVAECKTSETGCGTGGGCGSETGCGTGGGCGSGTGCSGGSGCGGNGEVSFKISSLFDCRAIVCKKIGVSAQKQFEKKAISYFDVSCTVEEALDKITFYYDRIDNHVSLRNKTD